MEFTTNDLLNILKINRNTFQVWLKEGFVRPEIQRSTKQGEPNLFSKDDLYRVWFFKYLVETGITRGEAANFYEWTDISFENVGSGPGQLKYLVITRERIPDLKRGRLLVKKIQESLSEIQLERNQVYALIVNLQEIKQEVENLLKR